MQSNNFVEKRERGMFENRQSRKEKKRKEKKKAQ